MTKNLFARLHARFLRDAPRIGEGQGKARERKGAVHFPQGRLRLRKADPGRRVVDCLLDRLGRGPRAKRRARMGRDRLALADRGEDGERHEGLYGVRKIHLVLNVPEDKAVAKLRKVGIGFGKDAVRPAEEGAKFPFRAFDAVGHGRSPFVISFKKRSSISGQSAKVKSARASSSSRSASLWGSSMIPTAAPASRRRRKVRRESLRLASLRFRPNRCRRCGASSSWRLR